MYGEILKMYWHLEKTLALGKEIKSALIPCAK